MAAEQTLSRKRIRERTTRRRRVIAGAGAAVVALGLLGTNVESPPPGGMTTIKAFEKIYVVPSKEWVVMVDYASRPEDPHTAARRAAELLGHLSGQLTALGVERAVLRVVETKRWFYFVTTSSTRIAFRAQRQPDGAWQLEQPER